MTHPERRDEFPDHAPYPGHPESFAKKSVVLFIIAVVGIVLLVVAGTGFAVWSNQHQVSSASQQWCTTLDLLTRTPVPKPADPKGNPSRETAYELYADFMSLKRQFGCS